MSALSFSLSLSCCANIVLYFSLYVLTKSSSSESFPAVAAAKSLAALSSSCTFSFSNSCVF